MKINQNTVVLVLLMTAVATLVSGCQGSRATSSPHNLFAKGSSTKSGHSDGLATSKDSRRAEIDFNAASTAATGRASTADGSTTHGEPSNIALASYLGQDKNEPQWLESHEEAVKLSKQTGRPILANFTGSNWCSYCIKLKNEVFDTPSFKNWAAENVILLELDFPRPNLQANWIKQQNNQLRSRYQIESYPKVLILNSEGGKLGSQGYMPGGPKRWISVAHNTIKANQALQKSELVNVVDYNQR